MSLSEPVPCPILDSCGACSRMRLTDEQELTEKVNGVEERLRHPVTMIHRSPKSLGYRARVRLRFGPDTKASIRSIYDVFHPQKKDVIYLDLTFEEASKFIVSAGTSTGKN